MNADKYRATERAKLPKGHPDRCSNSWPKSYVRHAPNRKQRVYTDTWWCHRKALWIVKGRKLCHYCFTLYCEQNELEADTVVRLSDNEDDFNNYKGIDQDEDICRYPRPIEKKPNARSAASSRI